MSKRILFSATIYQNGHSGLSTFLSNLIKNLQEIDKVNQYDIYAPSSDHQALGLPSRNFRFVSVPEQNKNATKDILWHSLAIKKLAKNYDLCFVPTLRRLPSKLQIPVLCAVHDLGPFRMPQKYGYLRYFYQKFVTKHLAKNVTHFAAVSHSTKSDLIKYLKVSSNKIKTIYHGIDQDLFKKTEAEKTRALISKELKINSSNYILFVSRIEHPNKNHRRLIEAFELLSKKYHYKGDLLFAGKNWNGEEHVLKRIEESPLKNRIKHLGFVEQKHLPLLYSDCDLVVIPSIIEGFGFPLLEALACQTRTVCSNTTSLGELAQDYIPTFDPLSVPNMAETINQGLTYDYPQSRISDYLKTFSWKQCALEYKRLIEEI